MRSPSARQRVSDRAVLPRVPANLLDHSHCPLHPRRAPSLGKSGIQPNGPSGAEDAYADRDERQHREMPHHIRIGREGPAPRRGPRQLGKEK
ncbi:hypothetical protein GCM10010256_50890 [Streptomyces coeruleorubidus]|nr:hypothetical protein GCM10010256_50890 [Streptomyces coeruleorubidus]